MEKRNNPQIIALHATSSIFFPKGDGVNSSTSKTFPASAIVPRPNLQCEDFYIKIEEKTDTNIQGALFWEQMACGNFHLSIDNPTFMSEPLNISYGTIAQLSLSLQLSESGNEESLEKSVENLTRIVELNNRDIQLVGDTLFQRGAAYLQIGNYEAAILDMHRVVALSKGRNIKAADEQKNISETIIKGVHEGIDTKSSDFDIALVPYFFLIKKIKENPDKTIKEAVGIEEINNIAAALAAFEEYELLERYVAEGNSLNVHTENWAFRSWQPTPFFYATCWKIYDNLKDSERLLRFLVKNGADPDMSSGDNFTVLWNATHYSVPIEKMKLLIELGCNVNKKSADGEFVWTPLINCLLQISDENDETIALPPNDISLEKAKFLIESGADINESASGLTPLMFAIRNCDHKDLDFIKFLLENGANPNDIDYSYTLTPLLLTHDYDWFEAGQLLLLYGAETETMRKLLENRANQHIESLTLTVHNTFRPGSGTDSETSKNYDLSEIEKLKHINFEYFNVYISEKTSTRFSGKVIFDCPETGVIKECGEFELSLENTEFYTESINFTYDIHTQLTLQIRLSDISLEAEFADEIAAKEQARRDAEFTQKLSDFQENTEKYLLEISKELKGSFYDFCINTELGQFFVNINAAEHAILYWFLVFGEPFKNITFRNRYNDVLQAIYKLDYEKDPDFRSEWYGYWQLFEAVYNNYRKMKTDTRHTDQEILDQYNKAENSCRESMRYLGDVAFVSVVACRYLQGDLFNAYGMDEEGAERKKECQSTLYNLSQRNDLFSDEQMQVLAMLRRAVSEVL